MLPVPVTEEQAKAVSAIAETTGKGIDAASKFLSYWADVFGEAPHDLFRMLIGDRLHHARIRKLHKIMEETQTILNQRGIKEPKAPSEDIAIPLLEAARQSPDELHARWAHLLANAMDPAMANIVRIEFVETLKRFHQLDALLLDKLIAQSGSKLMPDTATFYATQMKCGQTTIAVSLMNLERLQCIQQTPLDRKSFESPEWEVTFFGRELYAACTR
jgi:hypothetical protein